MCADPETDRAVWMDYTNTDESLVIKLRLNDDVLMKPGDSLLLKTGICLGCPKDMQLLIGSTDQSGACQLDVKDAYLDLKDRQLVVYMRNTSASTIFVLSREIPSLMLKCLKKGVTPVLVDSPSYIRPLPKLDSPPPPAPTTPEAPQVLEDLDVNNNEDPVACCYENASRGGCHCPTPIREGGEEGAGEDRP